ncbi:hypothetical protein FRAAL5269 [Frankia alni ACN14a]|uniref:Uncharacterized protein n=1 Tax=Frankia alni (strain DSM 45986 / CECT 9034 / ACN14a) TaxID=326424 RepID=Q0RF49_FRAAA|nr:hypothetical protein FRAAL5269 [Frankia alni ACN14a]
MAAQAPSAAVRTRGVGARPGELSTRSDYAEARRRRIDSHTPDHRVRVPFAGAAAKKLTNDTRDVWTRREVSR